MLDHFKLYNDLVIKIRSKNMELIKMKDDWYTISGTSFDEIKTKGGIKSDIADQLHNIVEKEKEIKGLIAYKNEVRKMHEKEIDKITNNRKRTILKLFYLDSCPIKQISYCLEISLSHAKRLKKEAIDEFLEKVKE